MPTRILWLSRHKPLARQLAELENVFPGCRITHDPNTFGDADDIMQKITQSGADEVVVVAPLSVVRALIDRGLQPIWAQMRSVPKESAEVTLVTRSGPRHYRHVRFHRIRKVRLDLEPLVPARVAATAAPVAEETKSSS